jgi:5-aminolevulinate synthase
VQHVRAHPEERARQERNVRRLKAMLQAAGMPLLDTPSHILPLIIGEAHQCRRTSELLLTEHGIYLQPINYPTVPRGQERLRITPTPFHTDDDMQHLVDALVAVRAQLGWSMGEALHEQTDSAASVRAAPLVFDATRTPDAAAGSTEREEPCSA